MRFNMFTNCFILFFILDYNDTENGILEYKLFYYGHCLRAQSESGMSFLNYFTSARETFVNHCLPSENGSSLKMSQKKRHP